MGDNARYRHIHRAIDERVHVWMTMTIYMDHEDLVEGTCYHAIHMTFWSLAALNSKTISMESFESDSSMDQRVVNMNQDHSTGYN